MLNDCGGYAGAVWAGLVGGFLITSAATFWILLGLKSNPKGAATLVLGVAWLGIGIAFSVWFYSAMLTVKLADGHDKVERNARIESLGRTSQLGARDSELGKLKVQQGSLAHELCVKSYEERITVLIIPIVLSISAGFGCALFTAWLTASHDSPYRKDQAYLGFTNESEVYTLIYQGVHWWRGTDKWLYGKVMPEGMRIGRGVGELPSAIVLIKTKAEIELEQMLATASVVLDPNPDLRQLVKKAVSSQS